MKSNIIALVLLVFTNGVLYSQRGQSEIDSILNSYDRKYRTTLNQSDYHLIEKQVAQIDTTCNGLEDIMSSREFSNNYKLALMSEFKQWRSCPSIVLDYVDLSKENEGSYVPTLMNLDKQEVYPVYQNIVKNEHHVEFFADYLFESDYLSSCEFLWENKSLPKIMMLSFIIEKGNRELPKEESCKMANF